MTSLHTRAPNPLGDLRAEADGRMLKEAFYESPDFRTLLDSGDRTIVVGRRGTGKSALHLRLKAHWEQEGGTRVLAISPEEFEVLALRRELERFGSEYRFLRAGATIAWKYALLMEVASSVASHFKFAGTPSAGFLSARLNEWRPLGGNPLARLRALVRKHATDENPAERVGALATALRLAETTDAVAEALGATSSRCVVLIDRLDEGYEPDSPGIGLVGGLVRAVSELRPRLDLVRLTVFLRDNIFRSVSSKDPDSSRDIEGQVLRLHWDEQQLFYLVTKRQRVAFRLEIEKDLKVWEECTAGDLRTKEGFQRCLRLTLFRPRDLLSLLNEAYLVAARSDRARLVMDDLEATARTISQNRLDDLVKEYSAVIPALRSFVRGFEGGPPRLPVALAVERVTQVLKAGDAEPLIQQDLFVHESAENVLRSLFGVGFIGIEDPVTGVFGFCHDGKSLDLDLTSASHLLIHPCYWMALGVPQAPLAFEEAEEINDEYEIHVASRNPEIRRLRLERLRDDLRRIPEGRAGERAFEEWCLHFVQLAFGGHLKNIEHHPNGSATQRRDIVARNDGLTPLWRRVLDDAKSRQVLFEAKNYEQIGGDEARQMASYLVERYGNLGFIITRSPDELPRGGVELNWVREIWNTQKKLIVPLSQGWILRLLGKLERPVKHDVANEELARLLDAYERMYLAGGGVVTPPRRNGQRKRGRRRRTATGGSSVTS